MSTLNCTPNFITAKSVENARKDTSMETVVGSDLETDSALSFFWDEPDSIPSVETKKSLHLLKRNSVKKSNSTPVKMSVQNIPPPPQHTRSVRWQYPEYSTFSERYETFWDWPLGAWWSGRWGVELPRCSTLSRCLLSADLEYFSRCGGSFYNSRGSICEIWGEFLSCPV